MANANPINVHPESRKADKAEPAAPVAPATDESAALKAAHPKAKQAVVRTIPQAGIKLTIITH